MYEFQKIITSIFLVVLVVFGIAKLSNFIFKTDENVVAYKVEVIEKEKAATSEKVFDLVMQRKSGELSDYNYSKALINHGKTWSFAELNGFLLKPATWIKGNKMGFAGLKDEKDRSSVILYMNESSDQPLPLP